jgi:flavin reductase (DIM6/NTAB) family NADH-FMN oxidoreductase RutF
MPLAPKLRKTLRKMLLGSTDLPQACDLSLPDPQTEITVWLHGMGEPRDVTLRHSVACEAPFIVCIGFEREIEEKSQKRLSLRFCERGGDGRLLGEISLRISSVLPTYGPTLYLFEAKSCRDFCLPQWRLTAHDLHHAYVRWKTRKTVNVRMSTLGDRCNSVMFICPRPVALVSLQAGENANIFPMNLMGTVGGDYFVFALNSKRKAAPLIERAGQMALSNIPFDQLATARKLGKNHYQESIDWPQLPFRLRRSAVLDIPVPEFAARVRELKIQMVHHLGSHTFFVARVVGEEHHTNCLQFHMIHGLYEAWRRRNHIPVQQPPSISSSSTAKLA